MEMPRDFLAHDNGDYQAAAEAYMSESWLLDLYCGAGGAAMGYHRSGFKIIGVDNKPQPNYPFLYVQDDAIDFLRRNGKHFAVAHASPPCQRYSRATKQAKGASENHPDLIGPTRQALLESGCLYVIENVEFAPLLNPIRLCGGMFPGLRTYRHRLFESNVALTAPEHQKHVIKSPRSNVYIEGMFMTIYGHVSPTAKAREVMGIDWPMSQHEVVQAIPPAYTEYLGRQLIAALQEHIPRLE